MALRGDHGRQSGALPSLPEDSRYAAHGLKHPRPRELLSIDRR
jgi:hypothetical protein